MRGQSFIYNSVDNRGKNHRNTDIFRQQHPALGTWVRSQTAQLRVLTLPPTSYMKLGKLLTGLHFGFFIWITGIKIVPI